MKKNIILNEVKQAVNNYDPLVVTYEPLSTDSVVKPLSNKKIKILKNIFIVAMLVGALVFTITIAFEDYNELLQITTSINILGLFGATICAIIYFLVFAYSGLLTVRLIDKEISRNTTLLILNTELLMDNVTIFSAGSQPVQATEFVKNGISLGKTTSILTINFIFYQLSILIFSSVMMILFFEQINIALGNFVWLIYIGFSFNTLIFLGLILLGFSKNIKKFFYFVLNLFSKIKIFQKSCSNLILKVDKFTYEFQSGVQVIFKQKLRSVLIVLIKILALICFYLVAYIIGISTGTKITFADMIYLFACANIATTMLIWIPTPGAAGGAEWTMNALLIGFGPFVGSVTTALVVMLLWRILTFYLSIIYGGISYLLLLRKDGKKIRKV